MSDFGDSQCIPINQDQVTNVVRGTYGNLDAEYIQTLHLTNKSGVYSYEVIFLELLTRRKSWERRDGNLSAYFLDSMPIGNFP